jgi:O-antigen ligase
MMLLPTIAPKMRSTVRGFVNKDWATFWESDFLSKWVPLTLGLILAMLVGLLISQGMWHFAVPLAFLIPVAILFLRYPFACIVTWLLVSPFLQTTPTMPERILYWVVHRAMPPATLVLIILATLLQTKKNRLMRWGRAELVLVPFLAIGLLSIILLQPGDGVVPTLYLFYDRLFISICLYWIVRLTTPGEDDLKRLLPVMLALVLIQCGIGLLTLFAPSVVRPDWRGIGEGARVTGTLRAPGAYTTTLVFFCLVLYHAAMQRKPGLFRFIFLFAFAFGSLMVFLSFSRGSWLGGVVAAGGLLIVYPKATIRMVIIVSIIMAAFGLGLLTDQIDWANERLQNKENAQARIVMYHTAAKMIQVRPFFGWGYQNFRLFRDEFKGRTNNFVVTEREIGIHNTFLGITTELGLAGFFSYIFPVIWWLWLTIKIWPRMSNNGFWSRRLLIVLWLAILNQVLVNSFMDMTHFPYGVGVWWITVGLIGSVICHHLSPGDIGAQDLVYQSSVR